MSESTYVAIITALATAAPPTLMALANFVMALKNKAKQIEMHEENKQGISEAKQDIVAGKESVDKLENQINSNLQKYIDAAIARALSDERLAVALEKK